MTRKKVKLAYIVDDSARKITFKKRKKGILKKVSELSILCGIQAGAVISSPFDSQTEVWPDPEGANRVIERYQNASVIDGSKNVNQETFIMQRIAKAKDHHKKLIQDNREKELNIVMFRYMQDKTLPPYLTVDELKDFEKLIDKKLKEIDNKIATLS